MELQNTLRLIIILLLFDVVPAAILPSSTESFSPIVIRAKYEIPYHNITNSSSEYVFLYSASNVSLDEINSFTAAFY